MDTRRLIIALVLVIMLVVTGCSHGTMLLLTVTGPIGWPTTWTGLSTDADDGGGEEHRDVYDTNGDGYAFYYAMDSQYLYLRMETVATPGWNSTGPQDEARYKWWFDTAGNATYIKGTTAYEAEFLLILEDLTDNSNDPNLTRDQLGELTLMDDLNNDNFKTRWDSAHPPHYTTNNAQTAPIGNSSWWRRELGTGTPGIGGPQGVMAADIGYRIDNASTGGNFVDMYVSWAALGNPSSLCLIWATDKQIVNLDQTPNLDRPEETTCFLICTPPEAAFNATLTSGCPPLTVNFADQSAGNITSWNWTFGDGGTSTLQNPSHQYTSTGSYNVTLNVTTSCGFATETKTNYITVYAKPTANAGVDKSFCAGSSVQIGGSPTGSGGTGPYTYSWTPTTGLDNPAIANPTASAVGTYTARVTDANGCWNEDSVLVTQNPSPAADAGVDKSIPSCGGSVTIGGSPTGSGGTGPYTYSWTPTGGLNDATSANPSALAGGTYAVRVTDANGCWAEDSVVVTVSGAPTANAGPDQDMCPGGSIQIGGSPTGSGGTGPYTYSWTPTAGLDNPAIANPTASPNSSTIYSVLVTDSDGCEAVDHVHVTVHTPTCHISASPNDSVCQGTTVTLTEYGGDAVSWSWSTGASTQSIQVTSSGTYNLTVTDTYGCQGSCQISVTVYDAPIADAGVDKEICAGGSVRLSGLASGGTPPYTYDWAGPENYPNTQNPTVSTVGNYILTVTDDNGCSDTDDVIVSQHPSPTANAGGDTGFCAGGSVQLSGLASGGTPPYTYDWIGPENHPNTQNPTVSTAGVYALNVTDGKGCSDTDYVIVDQYLRPTADAGPDAGITAGSSVVIGGTPTASSGTPSYTYSWNPTTGLNDTSIANPTASPAVNTTYTVNVTDSKGCTDSDNVTVTVTQGCCICGFVYRAGTMEPLAGWKVVLQKHTSPWVEIGSTITNANGKYCLCGLGAGNYSVSEVVKPGWNQVSPLPNQYLVTLPAGCCDPQSGPFLNFKNKQDPADPTVGWEASPIDKLAVLAPWIALFAATVVGVSLLLLRRRRAQS